MTLEAALPEGWGETTLGALADGGKGFQTGPFGSQLVPRTTFRPPAGVPAAGVPACRRAGVAIRRTGLRGPVPMVMPRDLVDG